MQRQLEECIGVARAYSVGAVPLRELVIRGKDLSLYALHAALKGRHVEPANFRKICDLFAPKALRRIELKICYVENFLGGYLTPAVSPQRLRHINPNPFFRIRAKRRGTPAARFHAFIADQLKAFGILRGSLGKRGSTVGGNHIVSPETISKFSTGKAIRPKKFLRACNLMLMPVREETEAGAKIADDVLSAAKILFGELYLNEALLGEDSRVFVPGFHVDYPRTAAVLHFCVHHASLVGCDIKGFGHPKTIQLEFHYCTDSIAAVR